MERKQQKLLVETAALAGELMLRSGAETFRAEDTMAHILRKGTTAHVTPLALTTSILVTLEDPEREPLTIVRRVPSGSTKLSRVVRINEISRDFCDDKISLEEAYDQLTHLKDSEYSRTMYNIATIGVAVGFTLFYGGSLLDAFAAFIGSTVLAMLITFGKKTKMAGFIMNCMCCAGMSFTCALLKDTILPTMDMDIVTIGGLMPVVPGAAITNAVRDTLQGDYISGSARMLEAFLKAASIALGVGIGVMLFRLI